MKTHVQVIKAMATPASSLMRRLPGLAATVIVLKPTIVDAQLDGAVRAVLLARTASQWDLPSHGAGLQIIKAGVCQQPYKNATEYQDRKPGQRRAVADENGDGSNQLKNCLATGVNFTFER